MNEFPRAKTAGRFNRPSSKRDRTRVPRQLPLSSDDPEVGANPSLEAQSIPRHQASAEQVRENQKTMSTVASPVEGYVASPLPTAVPVETVAQSPLLPTNGVTTFPFLTTSAVIRSVSTTTSPTTRSASATNSPKSLCSDETSCLTASLNLNAQVTPGPIQKPHQSLSSPSSSSGLGFLFFLAGVAIFAMTISILSCVVKRWYNKRQIRRTDNDTWRFLEQTPKNFEYPFFGFQGKPIERTIGFADQRCVSGFIEDKRVSWVVPQAPIKSHQRGLLGSYEPYTQERCGTYSEPEVGVCYWNLK